VEGEKRGAAEWVSQRESQFVLGHGLSLGLVLPAVAWKRKIARRGSQSEHQAGMEECTDAYGF
jgi:hypothetical protein